MNLDNSFPLLVCEWTAPRGKAGKGRGRSQKKRYSNLAILHVIMIMMTILSIDDNDYNEMMSIIKPQKGQEGVGRRPREGRTSDRPGKQKLSVTEYEFKSKLIQINKYKYKLIPIQRNKTEL